MEPQSTPQEGNPQNPAPGAPATSPADPQHPVDPALANPAPQDPPSTPPSTLAEPKTFDEVYVKGLRTENANWRTKFQDAQTKLDEIERAKLTKEQQLEADIIKLRTETLVEKDREIRRLNTQVVAGKLGVVDPEAVTALLDWTKIDGGTPVETAIMDLLEAKPYLKAPAQQPPQIAPTTPPSVSSPANPGNSSGAKPTFSKSQLSVMSPAEYEQRLGDIHDAMANGRVDWDK